MHNPVKYVNSKGERERERDMYIFASTQVKK